MAHNVMTAAGPVSSESLGVTSIHDHLITGMPGWNFDACYKYDKKAALEQCIREVNEAKKLGLNTLVEATCSDLARDPELFKNVQSETGVNIICTTGLYTQAMGNTVHWQLLNNNKSHSEALKHLHASYMRDLTEGIDGTDVKCGMLKVATGRNPITPFEALSIEAAAMAQKDSGVPIISHTESVEIAAEMADLLLGYGADPKKVMIGHLTDTDDLDALEMILKKGVYIGLDRFGLDLIFPDKKKVKNLVEMVRRGYVNKIMIGHDYTVYNHISMMPGGVEMPNFNLCGIFKTFIPQFKELGLTEEQIKTILIDNPRRFFEGK